MVQWTPPPANPQPPAHQGKLSGLTDGDYWRGGWSMAAPCDSLCVFAHVFEGRPLFFSIVRVCLWDVCVGGKGPGREGGGDGGAQQLNSRCLKSVGLTGCHKTAWLMESLGMSSPAVLMNLQPKGLMKRAAFAKTVPQLDLPDL